MCPPSSGSTGSRFSSASARLISPRRRGSRWIDCSERVATSTSTIRPRWRRPRVPSPAASPSERAGRLVRHVPGRRGRRSRRPRRRVAGPGAPRELEADAVDAVDPRVALSGPTTTRLPSRRTTIVNGSPLRRVDRGARSRSARPAGRRRDDLVAALETRGRGGPAGEHAVDRARRLGRAEHEERGEDRDRGEDVRQRPGRDDGDALRRRWRQYASGRERPSSSCSTRFLPSALLERRQLRTRAPLVAALERRVERVERAPCKLLLLRLEALAEVARPRPVHPGDLHVAAERERADAVLDAVPRRLTSGGAEAEVELPRPHPDPAGDEEVAGLVDEDQEREAEDGGGDAHQATGTSVAGAAVGLDELIEVARGRAVDAGERRPRRATAISRKPIRPSRNACTATSLAAL